MAHYVFTNSMKRHERSGLCTKLHDELLKSGRLLRVVTPLVKSIHQKTSGINRFKASTAPIYAIKTFLHKGVSVYVIVDQTKSYDVVFNTSPIDAAFVEFIRIVNRPDVATMVYTQHVLDRYNERIHAFKYSNHRDLIKRLIVNNPTKGDAITNRDTAQVVLRVKEGFLCGKYDTVHKAIIINTFFESEEDMDNKYQSQARATFAKMVDFTPKQLALYQQWRDQLNGGLISKDDFDYLLYVNRIAVD